MKVKNKDKNDNLLVKNKWDHAIEDSQGLIGEYQAEINELRDSIETFKARRDANAPWPGETATP
jgi:hypothetical protein